MTLPASFEAAAQRVRANADAYTSGADWQSWGNAESLAGARRADGPMSNELHTRADKRGKEEVERQAARGCLQRSGPRFEAGAQALADGALPIGGGNNLKLSSGVMAFGHGGAYHQANLASLASLMAAARRVQVFSAHTSETGCQNWSGAKLYTEVERAEDFVNEELLTWDARRGKEEVELQAARGRLQESGPSFVAGAQALADGALPNSGGKEGMRALRPPGDS